LLLFVCFTVFPARGEIVGDFDGDSKTTLKDVVILLAWYQITDKTSIEKCLARAQTILSTVSTVTRLPKEPSDSLSGVKVVLRDVVLMLAWYQITDKSDFSKVQLRANTILVGDYSALEYLPETPIGGSTVPVTITGIQLD
jgi:hypothetical protein